jgi:hypothetical protein
MRASFGRKALERKVLERADKPKRRRKVPARAEMTSESEEL